MFQNNRISIILRIVCLVTFIIVILFNKSIITLSLLTIFFYSFTRNENDSLLFWWNIITIISFIISYITGHLYLLKIVLTIGLSYYFLVINHQDIEESNKKVFVIDKYFYRFKNNTLRKDVIDINLINAIYITVHLFILFVTIMVG